MFWSQNNMKHVKSIAIFKLLIGNITVLGYYNTISDECLQAIKNEQHISVQTLCNYPTSVHVLVSTRENCFGNCLQEKR